jgi:signal transduction histidine kinase
MGLDNRSVLEGFAGAVARLTARLEVAHVAGTAVEVLVAEFDAALARIWLHRPERGVLELVASAGLSTATATSRRARIEVAGDPHKLGEVARGRRPLVRNGLEGDAEFEQDWVAREQIAAAALFPLVVADELLGVAACFTRRPLHEEAAGALAAFAAVLGTALHDARQLAAARAAQAATNAALARAALLAEAGRVLAGSLDDQASLTRIAELLVPGVADLCRIDMLDEEGTPALVASAAASPELARAQAAVERDHPIAGRPDSGQRRVIASGEAELVGHLGEEAVARRAVDAGQLALVTTLGLTSYLCVPLAARGQVLGALTCADTSVSGRHLGPDDLALASELASTAAVAVANARLYRQAQRANRALERSNADLEQFAYTASHDLREPLRAVAGYAQLLKARYGDRLDQDAHEYMTFMVDGAKRLQLLTDGLLAYSRVDNQPLTRTPVDLGRLPTVEGDEAQLLRVLQNLVANAVKFTEPGRPAEVELSARRDQRAWQVSVADRGIGVDPAGAGQVFQMFKRLHTRDEYPGSGIGLSLCRRIVERHGGRIWFEPRPGGGTVFHFTLPDRP